MLLTLLQNGPTSRVRLAQLTGLSTTTITNLINQLLTQGLVSEMGKEPDAVDPEGTQTGRHAGEGRAEPVRETNGRSSSGRPATPLGIVPGARHALGLHFGVDTLRAGITDLFGELTCYRVLSHSVDMPVPELLQKALGLADEVVGAFPGRQSLVGAGIGASGLVDPDTGVNVLAPNLGWRGVPLREAFGRHLNLPVFVDNNVRAMALAESMFGAGRGVNNLAFVYGRIGVGAGFVLNGELYRGSRAGAGEIGHMTAIPAGGAPCRCGNTGCLETLVSEPEILRQARVLAGRAPESLLAAYLNAPPGADGSPDPPIERVFAAARAGDREAQALLNERAYYMGTALANLINLINPEMIILGGLFAMGQDLLLPQIEETMRRRSFAGLGETVQLRVTSFGREVGVIGAAALALDTFFYRQDALPVT